MVIFTMEDHMCKHLLLLKQQRFIRDTAHSLKKNFHFQINKLEINPMQRHVIITLSSVIILYQHFNFLIIENYFLPFVRYMLTHMVFCSENSWGTYYEKLPCIFLIVQPALWWVIDHADTLLKKGFPCLP